MNNERILKLAKIAQYQNDVCLFLKDFFPHHFSKDFAYFHREIFEELKSHNRIAIAAPRKSGKTEIITFGWVMYNLLLNPDNRFTVLIANNYANACKFLAPIKEEFEHNAKIKDYFGDLKSEKWAENEIELTCKKKVIVGGNDFKIRGQKYLQYRPDLIIIDDAEDDELVRSDVRRGDFEHWLLYSLEPAMTQEGNQIVMVGTILHRDSQLSKILIGGSKYTSWKSVKYEAIKDGKSLWEEGMPYTWLVEERSKDPYRFAQEYMNNPVPFEHAMFKEDYFDNYSDDKLPNDLIINITVDLACSDKTYSDYTVILPVGIDGFGDLWILPYKRGRYVDPDEIINLMFGEYHKYSNARPGWKFGKFGIEKVAFQRFLIRNFDRERKKRGIRFVVEEVEAKGDKVTRIAQLQPWFASKDIHIRADMLDLKEELLDFPRARHDDVCDALAYHLSFANRKPSNKIFTEEGFKVTPEKQRDKHLHKVRLDRRPKIYSYH